MENKDIELVSSVIGIPYESGSMGPKTFDCWGLVRYIEKELFNRELQIILHPEGDNVRELIKFIREHPEHKNWVKNNEPEHGGVVEMSNSIHPHHIGVYLNIDGGGVLHCSEAGVTFDSLFNLKSAGWGRLIFYRYNN